eukprot:2071234-Pyramimonas_sp.AAC.1
MESQVGMLGRLGQVQEVLVRAVRLLQGQNSPLTKEGEKMTALGMPACIGASKQCLSVPVRDVQSFARRLFPPMGAICRQSHCAAVRGSAKAAANSAAMSFCSVSSMLLATAAAAQRRTVACSGVVPTKICTR